MTLPSVGRVVHYRSRGSADGRFAPECRAAIITEVGPVSGAVASASLCVLNPSGMFFDQDVPQSEVVLDGGTWHWPERVEEAQ